MDSDQVLPSFSQLKETLEQELETVEYPETEELYNEFQRKCTEVLEKGLKTADRLKSKELFDEFARHCTMSKELWNRRRKLSETKIFPEEFYANLDPTYSELIKNLEDNLAAANVLKSKELLDDFSSKYMMPKKLWDLRFDMEDGSQELSMYHFYYDEERWLGPYRNSQNLDYLPRLKLYFVDYDHVYYGYYTNVEDFLFPHKQLEFKMHDYQKQVAENFVSKKQLQIFEKMLKIFDKIKTAEGDDEKWFAALLETDDFDFVKDNVEYRIGINLSNKKLWKLYIEYLKEKDLKILLQVYSKYCRFFLDDLEVKEEYKKIASLQKAPVPVTWKNLFDFEEFENVKPICDKTDFWDRRDAFFGATERPPNVTKLLDSTIQDNYKTAVPQNFAFKEPLLNYIVENADAYILSNLFKSCKWFYVKFPIQIRYNLDINGHHSEFVQNQRNVISNPNSEELQVIFKNVFIVTNFYFADKDEYRESESISMDDSEDEEENAKHDIEQRKSSDDDDPPNPGPDTAAPIELSPLIPLIHKCSARFLNLGKQKLTLAELEFLVADAKELFLYGEYFKNGKHCMLEDILTLTPKVFSFVYRAPKNVLQWSQKTSQALTELPNKFVRFKVGDIFKGFLDPNDFVEFVKNSVPQKTSYCTAFHVRYDFEDDERRNLIKNINEIVNSGIKKHFDGNDYTPDVDIKTIKGDNRGQNWEWVL